MLESVFRQVAGPLAVPETTGAWWRGLRLLALDGTQFDVPDSMSNGDTFDGPSTCGTPFGFPQVRAGVLVEVGTHAVLHAGLGGYRGRPTPPPRGRRRRLALNGPRYRPRCPGPSPRRAAAALRNETASTHQDATGLPPLLHDRRVGPVNLARYHLTLTAAGTTDARLVGERGDLVPTVLTGPSAGADTVTRALGEEDRQAAVRDDLEV